MARPREFDEAAALDAAMLCFWRRGYDGTSVKDLVGETGLAAASIYNAFGDKRALYRQAFDRYVEGSVADRIRRLEGRPPREAVATFLREILDRSLKDDECKGCLLVNAALETEPRDPDLRRAVAAVLVRIEAFFLDRVETGQADGTVTRSQPAADLARHLLGTLIGVRVLARARPETALLEGIVSTALALLDPRDGEG